MRLAILASIMVTQKLLIKGFPITKNILNLLTTIGNDFTSFVISVAAGVLLLLLSI